MLSDAGPLDAPSQNDEGDAPCTQVLLVAYAPVGREQELEPASSAAFSKAQLLSVSHPLDWAVWIACPGNARISPFGVPWSKRMSTGGDRVGAEALCYELQDGCDLLAGHVELLHDLLDT